MVAHCRLLVVEDDPTSRRLLASLLVNMGYNVTSAATGEEAMSVLYSEEWCDAVLTDVVMPGISGIELANCVHDVRPEVPVVLVTGAASAIDLAANLGMLALCKPITRERLAAVLDEALDAPA